MRGALEPRGVKAGVVELGVSAPLSPPHGGEMQG
jgi:hypothetical protein